MSFSRHRDHALLVVIAFVGSLLAGCQDHSKSLSAEEYFDRLLKERGYPTGGLSLEQVKKKAEQLQIPIPEGQLQEMVKAAGPKGKLRPFLDDLMRNLPEHHHQELPKLFVGEIPWGDMNAQILRAPDGSLLILVGRDLSIALYEWSKLLVNMILILQPHPEFPPDASLDELVERFISAVEHYAETSEVLRQSLFATDEKRNLAALLSASATQFVLTHEYSHAALGHVDDEPDVATAKVLDPGPLPPEHWKREAGADRFAAELLLRDSGNWMFDRDMRAAGMLYAIGTLEALERIEGRRDLQQFAGRLQQMKGLLRVGNQKETLPFTNTVAEAMQLVSDNLEDLPRYISEENVEDLPRYIAESSTQGFDSAYSPREEITKPARLGTTELRNLLDTRDATPSPATRPFNAFMLRFYAAHQAGDWSTMQSLAVNEKKNVDRYFDQLAAYGLFSAFEGMESYDVPWDSRKALRSLEWAELAMSLVAASQRKESPRDAELRPGQLEILEAIWRRLYWVSLMRAGARSDPPPGESIQEAFDKSEGAVELGMLLNDPELTAMGVVAVAWTLERTGEHEKTRNLLDTLGVKIKVVWPPITREKGEIRAAFPIRFHRSQEMEGSASFRLNKLILAGERLVVEGYYNEAQKTLTEALEISERELGSEDPTTATVLNNLATARRYGGRFAEAEELFRRSLAVLEKAHGPNDPRIIAPLGNLAGVLRARGRVEQAKQLYERGIRLLETTMGPGTLEMANLLNNLAELYREQGRYSEAKPLYRKALRLWRDLLGRDHSEYAKTLINFGLLLSAEGRFREAESMYRDAISIFEHALGGEHPDLAVALLNLAALQQRIGRYEESERLLLRALKIATSRLGPWHPDVGTCWNNLGGLFQTLRRTEDARKAYLRALEIRKKAWGAGHKAVLQTRNNLRSLEEGWHGKPKLPQSGLPRRLSTRASQLDEGSASQRFPAEPDA